MEDYDAYTLRAIDYARAAIKEKRKKPKNRRQGKYLILAAERFLNDLKRAQRDDCPFYYSPFHADEVCWFVEQLPHVEGTWDSETIILHDAQVFFLVQLFGFRNRSNDRRRFTSALFCVARKNAKSTLAAAILLYCFCYEMEAGAQIKSAATTYDQAAIIFGIAKRIVEKESEFRKHFGLQTFAKSIVNAQIGGSFQPIHSKASTQDGLNSSHTSLDEIHAHKSPDLLNVLTSAAGARESPLWLYTTTEGYANTGPWPDLRLFAKKLLDRVFGDEGDHFLAVLYMVDPSDNDFDDKTWVKANPLIDSNPFLRQAIERDALEAREMPSKLSEFRIKRLNRAASVAEGWVDIPKFQACNGKVDFDFLKDYPCFGGIDLASQRDLSAFRLVWIVDEVIYTAGWRWLPESAADRRKRRATVPVDAWIEQGLIRVTPGETTDYDKMADEIVEICDPFDVRKIGYDQWNAGSIVQRLEDAGLHTFPFAQNCATYHAPMQRFERAYLCGKMAHGGDPVLAWCASNIVAFTDSGLRMKPDRKRALEKIDDMAAFLMAIGAATEEKDDASFLTDLLVVNR